MKSQGFHHIAIFTNDVEQLSGFYRATFGLPELERFHGADGALRSIWLGAKTEGSLADGFLAIEAAPPGVKGSVGFAMVALRIDGGSRTQVKAALVRAGLTIERETGWTMYVKDPEGNLIGLSHHPHAAPA